MPRPRLLLLICATCSILLVRESNAAWPGNPLNGNVALCAAVNGQYDPVIVSDGSGGAIAAWNDDRGSGTAIAVQRVSGDGVALWTTDGVVLSPSSSNPNSPQNICSIVSDGALHGASDA